MTTWRLPATGRVTSPYGPRVLTGAIGNFHAGTDIGARRGPVRAAQDGVVRTIWQTRRGAWVVDLRHADDEGRQVRTRYVHMYRDEITVKVGERVRAGQRIGRSGASGTGAAHLHFEVLVDGSCADPEVEMARRGVRLGRRESRVSTDTVPHDAPETPDPPETTTPEHAEAPMAQILLDRITHVRTAQAAHTSTLALLAERLMAVRITLAAHTQTLAAIKAAVTGSPAPVVDEEAIAHGIAVELAPVLTAAVLDALPSRSGLTPAERRALVQEAVRQVLEALEARRPVPVPG